MCKGFCSTLYKAASLYNIALNPLYKVFFSVYTPVTICTQEKTGVSVITLEDQAAQLKDCGTATAP